MFRYKAALHGKKPIKSCYICARPKNTTGDASYRELYATCRRAAIARNITFELSLKEHKEISSLNCHYCGEPPKSYNRYLKVDGTLRSHCQNIKSETIKNAWIKVNGIDRKNNLLGYIFTNSVACCYDCNVAKAEMTANQYIDLCRKVVEYNK